jgi:hypothetical protein
MKRLLFLLLPILLLTACQPARNSTLELARSTENSVEVIIALTRADDGQVLLSATFTPTGNGLHLYSKDIPRKGIEGLGRPALLELPAGSTITVNGGLIESASAQSPLSGPQDLRIYPAGAITLNLPIILPAGTNWLDEQVVVTYMACTEYSCRPPVEGKVIPIRIPEAGIFN